MSSFPSQNRWTKRADRTSDTYLKSSDGTAFQTRGRVPSEEESSDTGIEEESTTYICTAGGTLIRVGKNEYYALFQYDQGGVSTGSSTLYLLNLLTHKKVELSKERSGGLEVYEYKILPVGLTSSGEAAWIEEIVPGKAEAREKTGPPRYRLFYYDGRHTRKLAVVDRSQVARLRSRCKYRTASRFSVQGETVEVAQC